MSPFNPRRAWMVVLVALALVGGCGDDGGGDDANNAPNNDAPNNDAPNNDANNDVNNAPNNDAPNNDVNNDIPRPACEVIEPATQAEAVYDAYLLPPLEEFVNDLIYVEATVSRDGDDVVVTVDEDTIPAVFEDPAGELGHCVANPDVRVLKLCFFRADGAPANAGALGAIFRPLGSALFAVVAHRRGVSRPCTHQGHYPLSATAPTIEGDEALGQEALGLLDGYISLFVVDGVATVFMGGQPRPILVDFSASSGRFSGSIEDDFLLLADDSEVDLELSVEGTFNLGDDGVATTELSVTATVSGAGATATVSFEATGTRL